MDYIREELLRQQAALTQLLLGSGRNREEEAEERDPAREEIPSAEETYFWNSRKLAALEEAFGRSVPAAEQRSLLRDAAAKRRNLRHGMTEEQKWLWHDMAEETAEVAAERERSWERAGGFSARPGETLPVYHRYYGTSSGETAVEEMVSVVTEDMSAAAAETVRAKELSRIFQRDARRYDGGFTLF